MPTASTQKAWMGGWPNQLIGFELFEECVDVYAQRPHFVEKYEDRNVLM